MCPFSALWTKTRSRWWLTRWRAGWTWRKKGTGWPSLVLLVGRGRPPDLGAGSGHCHLWGASLLLRWTLGVGSADTWSLWLDAALTSGGRLEGCPPVLNFKVEEVRFRSAPSFSSQSLVPPGLFLYLFPLISECFPHSSVWGCCPTLAVLSLGRWTPGVAETLSTGFTRSEQPWKHGLAAACRRPCAICTGGPAAPVSDALAPAHSWAWEHLATQHSCSLLPLPV